MRITLLVTLCALAIGSGAAGVPYALAQPSTPAKYSDPTTPQGTLRTFSTALTRADLPQAANLLQGAAPLGNLGDVQRAMRKRTTNYSINHLRIAQNGDTATISFFFAVDPLPNKSTYESWVVLRQKNGKWMIDPARTLALSNGLNPFAAFVSLLSGQREGDQTSVSAIGRRFLILGEAMRSFINDNGDKFALGREQFREALLPYYPALDTVIRPVVEQGGKVSFNTRLTDLALDKIRAPARTVMLYEGENGKLNFGHQGRAIVVLVNGNVRFIDATTAKKNLTWLP